MNITTELEKLVALRDRGDLTQAEFEEAKSRLFAKDGSGTESGDAMIPSPSKPKPIPGLSLAIGVFVGNVLAIGIFSGNIQRGIAVGAIAAVLVLLFYGGLALLKGR